MAASARRAQVAGNDWRPNALEARQLAGWVRSERLTLLVAKQASDATSLLTGGVLPLLGRREADALTQARAHPPGSVVRFPDRRGSAPPTELLVLFSGHQMHPLDALSARLDATAAAAGCRLESHRVELADCVEALTETHGARVLIVIDRFDALFEARADRDQSDRLMKGLAELVSRTDAGHLLLTINERSSNLVRPFFDSVHPLLPKVLAIGAGPSTLPLRFAGLALQPPPDQAAAARAMASSRPTSGGQPPTLRTPHGEVPGADLVSPAANPTAGRRRVAGVVGAIGVMAVVSATWFANRQPAPLVNSAAARAPVPVASPATLDRSVPRTEHPPATPPVLSDSGPPKPSPLTSVAEPRPQFGLFVDAAGERPDRMLAELANALGQDGAAQVELRAVTGSALTSATTLQNHMQGLAVVSYAELKAGSESAAPPRVAVLASLATQPVTVLVRTDSPIHYLHELKGRRINVGPPGGGRAVNARLLYERMFDAPMPVSGASRVAAPEAMGLLLVGGSLDAVVLVGSQAETALATLSDSDRRAVRPLGLLPGHAASRKALQVYLPTSADSPGRTAVVSLASMNFLVASPLDDPRQTDRFEKLTDSLCHQLGKLQRDGDPTWREVQPGLQLPIQMPHVDTRLLDTVWAHCPPPKPVALATQ